MHTLSQDAPSLQAAHELDVFGKRGLTLVRGEGARLYDHEGRAYIDCIGGQGAANLGHGHPELAEAIAAQAERLISCPGAFYNDVRAAYLAALTAVTPAGLDRAFLCNSGTESVEAALKFARLSTGRTRFLAARRAFHGRSFGAMSATFNPNYSKGCGPLVPGFSHIPYNDVAALEAAMNDQIAAVILEVVQGEGGVRPAESGYLEAVRLLCDRHGALLILDEVQTGFGRTGTLFACCRHFIAPDILCLAKSIAGGLPMGATVVNDRISVPLGRHGTTFGGNPLASAAALKTLEILERDRLPEAAAVKGAHFIERLRALSHPLIREVRGLGLMVGVELGTRVKPVIAALTQRGILALPAGPNVLRFLPPLVIEAEDLDTVVDEVDQVLANL